MRRANGTGYVFKMKDKSRRNPWRVRITVGWNRAECRVERVKKIGSYYIS